MKNLVFLSMIAILAGCNSVDRRKQEELDRLDSSFHEAFKIDDSVEKKKQELQLKFSEDMGVKPIELDSE